MHLTHRQLIDLTVQFNHQAGLDIANKSTASLVLVHGKRKPKSLEDKAYIVDIFLTKGMLNRLNTCAMDNFSKNDDGEIVFKPNVPRVPQNIFSDR